MIPIPTGAISAGVSATGAAAGGGLGSMLSAGGASTQAAQAGQIAGQASNALGGIGMSFMGAQNQDGLADTTKGQDVTMGVAQGANQLGGQLMSSGNPIAMGVGAGINYAASAAEGVVDLQRRLRWEPEEIAQITAGMYEEAEMPEFDDEQFVSTGEFAKGLGSDLFSMAGMGGGLGGALSAAGRIAQFARQKKQRKQYDRQYAERQQQAYEHNQAVRNTQRERNENREILSMIGMPMMGTL